MNERNKHDQELVDAGFAPDAEEVEILGEPVASPQVTEIHELINTKSGLIGVRAVQPAAGTTPPRNSEVLADFVKYCEAHPDHRFWQALRNWSGYGFIVATNEGIHHRDLDTFYWEGRRHDK